ncbi:protein adenylyltransferase SelO [Paenibacillus gansuensis]|uniref:Protein nucleotidyltransferase YdiU n=1 Tax=Paenibacillus gansuensis TaxID=306542 RepID=A0ABW5PKD0_9BACL
MDKGNKQTGWNFNNSYANLPETFYTRQLPTPVRAPKAVLLNESLAQSLGLNIQELQSDEGSGVLGGNAIPEGALPLAQAYAGHQFGYFTMLGDGRAVLLGEQVTPQGERFDIQLKGSGRTPYSRGGDGRAALGPMLREYIISEAMHALGIPTTRSLAVTATGEAVIREQDLPGAVLTRVAASHIRVGTFQYAANYGTAEDLKALADYTIHRHYPDIKHEDNKYVSLLKEVIGRQAALIAKWMQTGFIHGVMNTDNMTLSGETIDYGPCAFMDVYDPATVFSSIDSQGRYAYGNQPKIAAWNLARLAESLLPLLNEQEDQAVKTAEEVLSGFAEQYHKNYLDGMRKKLGLFDEEPEDEALIGDLLSTMHQFKADYTNTFRILTLGTTQESMLSGTPEFTGWLERWQARLSRQAQSKTESLELMRNSNPSVIPRNYKVEEALEAATVQGDFSVLHRLLKALSSPYDYSCADDEYTALPEPTARPYRTFCGT